MEKGDDKAAFGWLSKSVQLNPKMPFGHATLAALHAHAGDMAAANRHAEELARLAPWLDLDKMMQRLVGSSQKGHEPKRLITGLQKVFAPGGPRVTQK